MTKLKNYKLFLLVIACLMFSGVRIIAQDIIIQQSVTGESRTDARGQAFIPSEFGTGVGNTFGQASVYLNTFSIYYAGATQADKLYIYETLPISTTDLDAGTGGVLVGESFANETEAGKTTYHFGSLALGTNTSYFAVFREDVELSYGEDISVAGPYPGGKMLINNGAEVVENDFTALQFSAELSLTEHVNQGDLEALVALYESADGPNWYQTWDLTGNPLHWYNVGWDMNIGRVVSLSLGKNQLSGKIPNEIGNLTKLTSLDLRGGHYPEIPKEIGNLIELRSLNLWACELEGEIPDELWDLVQLSELDLERNFLSGKVSPEINNLTNLRVLNLRNNQLTFLPQLLLPAIEEIDVIGNFMQNDSFEHNIDVITNENISFGYYQYRVPFEDSTFVIGEDYLLTVDFKGENNEYQWFKGVTPINEASSDPSLILGAMTEEDIGLYNCRITNTLIPGSVIQGTEQFWLFPAIEFDESNTSIVRVNASSIEFQIGLNREHATLHYLILPYGDDIPSAEQILDSLDTEGNHVDLAGNLNTGNTRIQPFILDGLEFSTAYDFYFVVIDRTELSSDLVTYSATTGDPVHFVEEPAITYLGANRVKFDVNLSNQAQLYSVVHDEDNTLTLDEVLSFINPGTSVRDIALFNETIEVEISESIYPSQTHYITLVAVDYDNYATEIKKYEITALDAIAFVEDNYPKAVSYISNEIQLSGMVTRDASVYYSVFEGEREVVWPSLINLKDGFDGNGTSAFMTDSLVVSANTLFEIDVLGLKENIKYQIFLFAEDEDHLLATQEFYIEDLSTVTVTGLDQQDFGVEELSISPNPMKDKLSIDFKGNEQYHIDITDLKGQSVYTKSNLFGSQDINLQDLQRGIYLINVHSKNKSSWKRIVKQ